MYGAAGGLLPNAAPPTAFPPGFYPYGPYNGMTPYGAPYGMGSSDFEDDDNDTSPIKDISKAMMEKGENPSEWRLMDSLPSKSMIRGLFLCWLVPVIFFVVVYWAKAMWIRYDNPLLSKIVAAGGFAIIIILGLINCGCLGKKWNRMSLKDPRIDKLMFVSCVGAWILSDYAGDFTFKTYTQPYYDLLRSGTHKEVNPHKSLSGSVMDAGIIDFVKSAKLDLEHSINFVNNEVYCVAPITTKGMSNETSADTCLAFWAVGINCCPKGKFECGDYKSPDAHSGVRLMNEHQRDFFALAVQKANAAFNLAKCQPTFVHWLEKPEHEERAMYYDYMKSFGSGIVHYLCFQLMLICVFVATAMYLKM